LNRPCYFIDKAYHAQAAGADALLVVNDNPGDLSTAVAPKDEDSSRWADNRRHFNVAINKCPPPSQLSQAATVAASLQPNSMRDCRSLEVVGHLLGGMQRVHAVTCCVCVPPTCCTAVAFSFPPSRELAQITIPAGLVSQADGEAIKELLRKGSVSVALNWTDLMPKASKVGKQPVIQGQR
jgi:hypothetical protein